MSKGKQQAQGLDSTLPSPVFTDGFTQEIYIPRT